MPTLNSIADFLATLNDKERDELRTQLAYNDTVATRVTGKFSLSENEELFWGCMLEAMRNLRLDLPGPVPNVIGNTPGKLSRKTLSDCATGLNDFVQYACCIKLDKTHHRAICVVVLTCLIRWMKRRRLKDDAKESYFIRISPQTICREIGDLPRAVSLDFPGYVASRMLHVVVPREIDRGRLRVA